MSFLVKAELKTATTLEIVDLITRSNDSIVSEIIDESIDLMRGYLYEYYDTDAIFNAEEEVRSLTVLKHLKGIVVYEIYKRRSRVVVDSVKEGYNEAMRWLEKIGDGKIKPDLPPIQDDTDGDGVPDADRPFMKMGSRKSYKNHW